ncbi:hypothetical protein ACFFRR_007511 [Megaselia abdita]
MLSITISSKIIWSLSFLPFLSSKNPSSSFWLLLLLLLLWPLDSLLGSLLFWRIKMVKECSFITKIFTENSCYYTVFYLTYFDSEEGFCLLLKALASPSSSYLVFNRCKLAKLNGSGTTTLMFPSPSLLSS